MPSSSARPGRPSRMRSISQGKTVAISEFKSLWSQLKHRLTPKRRGPRKKAVLVAVSGDADAPLSGPIKDVAAMEEILIDQFGYKEEDIVVMTDAKEVERRLQPTRKNVLHQLEELGEDAHSGDHLFFFFAGHGSQLDPSEASLKDVSRDDIEVEGGDIITARDLQRRLVDHVPGGAQLITMVDACHSGTLLELPYRAPSALILQWRSHVFRIIIGTARGAPPSPTHARSSGPAPRSPTPFVALVRVLTKIEHKPLAITGTDGGSGSMPRARSSAGTSKKAAERTHQIHRVRSKVAFSHSSRARGKLRKKAPEGRRVIAWSAAADDEEDWEDDANGGSLASGFANIIKHNPGSTYRDVVFGLGHEFHEAFDRRHQWAEQNIKRSLTNDPDTRDFFEKVRKSRDHQTPQLSSLQPLDMDERLEL